MSVPEKILIDTNIIFGLEDNKKVQASYSGLNRMCGENGVQIFVHESSIEDIAQDTDEERRQISLSKLEKYPRINKTPQTKKQKEDSFGFIRKRNDDVDTDLLVSLSLGVVDLVVTEDQDFIARVKDHEDLREKVLNVQDALSLLDAIFGNVLVDYKHVEEKKCDQFDCNDPFFDSLKEDYEGFEKWFAKCMREQRECWAIESEESIAGIIIRNEESQRGELDELEIPGEQVLKLCLFKTAESISGEKYGEQLLKAAMDFAFRNEYDVTFLTVLPKQEGLIRLISRFGFQRAKDKGEEHVYYKYTKVLDELEVESPFDFHRCFWPCVKCTDVDVYVVPIKPEFHARLFPEAHVATTEQLDFGFDERPQTPGNAIRKIYVCNAMTRTIAPGSILLFYRTGGGSLVTSVGVLEEYIEVEDHEHLVRIASGRSVYSHDELADKRKAVNFYYAEDFEEPISLVQLREAGLLMGAPQSITKIDLQGFLALLESALTEKDREIFYE